MPGMDFCTPANQSAWDKRLKPIMNECRNLLFHLALRIPCGAGQGRVKGVAELKRHPAKALLSKRLEAESKKQMKAVGLKQ